MNKVIFVCLLSLSVCLGQQNPQQVAASPQPTTVSAPNATGTEEKSTPTKPEQPQTLPTETKAPNGTTSVVPKQTENQTATAQTNTTQSVPTPNETSTKSNETKPAETNNTTDAKPNKEVTKPADEKKIEPSKDKNETKTVVPADKMNNGTSTDGKYAKKNETTTPKGDNVSPTGAPIQTKTRAFDGPSFIGGMILTLGLLAIGFMGFKYYKNQTERNYHTL